MVEGEGVKMVKMKKGGGELGSEEGEACVGEWEEEEREEKGGQSILSLILKSEM